MTAQDPIELLLPEAGEELHDLARRVTTLARLVVDDARPKLAQSERLDFASAREELEREQSSRLAGALDSLLAVYAGQAVRASESFFLFPAGPFEFQEAWEVVLEARAEHGRLPAFPQPAESALAVAHRLCDALGELRFAPIAARRSTWLAVLRALEAGPVAGEVELRAVLEGLEEGSEPRLVAHIAECMLERGGVREAMHWLEEKRSLFCECDRLRQLREWCRVLTESWGSEELPEGITLGDSLVPSRLRSLFESYGRGGEAANSSDFTSRVREREAGDLRHVERSTLGLSCLAVFSLGADGTATAIRVEAAPALKERVPAWLEERADACAIAEDPQQRLFVRARETVCHRSQAVRSAALAGEGALALALTPILDPAGEVAGWIHFESEHHLLPSGRTRAQLVETWRDAVLHGRRAGETALPSDEPIEGSPIRGGMAVSGTEHGESAQVFQGLLEELGLGLTHRRAQGFDVEGEQLTCVLQEGLALSSDEIGGQRALFRSLRSGGAVLFEEPDPRLSLHARAGCGFVVPIRLEGKLIGLFSLESSRRRDLGEPETRRAFELAAERAVPLACAQFAREHRQRHGVRPLFDAKRADFNPFFRRAIRVAESREALVLAGPRGSGKRVLARLVARLAGFPEPVEWTVEAKELEQDFEGWVERLVECCGEVLLLEGVEELEAAGQARLLRAVEQAGPSAPRLWTRLSGPLSQRVAEGRLTRDLALRLGRLELFLPSLAQRREEIPALAAALLSRLAEAEERAVPHLDDEASALLWRQPWAGNIRELEATLARALHEAGESLTSEGLIAGALLAPPVARLSSRTPARTDLVSALWTTRKRNGRGNRRRAALYLGWDPETLARRCTEADVPLETLEPPTPWHSPPT